MFGDKQFPRNNGYPTPIATPTEMTCLTLKIPADSGWWAVFSGLLLTLTDESAWQQFEGGITREDAAHCAAEIYQQAMDAAAIADGCGNCTLPDGGIPIQQDEFGFFKMLDNGEWVQPSGAYTLPPLNPRTEPTDQERRCAAAANAANVMQQLYEQLADEYATNHDLALFFFAIGAGIATLFLPPLGLLAASFLAGATILVSEGFTAFSFLTADVWTEDFTDAFACILYDNSTVEADDSVTFAFDQVINDVVNSLAFTFDVTLAAQRLALQLGTILKYVGADGLNYAGSTTAITEYDCTDCGGWGFDWSMLDDDHAFGTYSDAWGAHAIYNSGVGWEAHVSADRGGGERATFFSLDRLFPSANYKHVEIDVQITRGTYTTSPFTVWEVVFNGVTLLSVPATDNYSGTVVWDGDDDMTDPHVSMGLATEDVLAYTNGSSIPSGGSATFTRLFMCGSGESPLDEGEDCE